MNISNTASEIRDLKKQTKIIGEKANKIAESFKNKRLTPINIALFYHACDLIKGMDAAKKLEAFLKERLEYHTYYCSGKKNKGLEGDLRLSIEDLMIIELKTSIQEILKKFSNLRPQDILQGRIDGFLFIWIPTELKSYSFYLTKNELIQESKKFKVIVSHSNIDNNVDILMGPKIIKRWKERYLVKLEDMESSLERYY